MTIKTFGDAISAIEAEVSGVRVLAIQHHDDWIFVTMALGQKTFDISTPLGKMADLGRAMPSLLYELRNYCVREGII